MAILDIGITGGVSCLGQEVVQEDPVLHLGHVPSVVKSPGTCQIVQIFVVVVVVVVFSGLLNPTVLKKRRKFRLYIDGTALFWSH